MFIDRLAELGVDKGLMKNKKVLSDFIEKEKGYQSGGNTSENEGNVESSSDREDEEIPKRATTTLETTVRKEKVIALNGPERFTLKIPVNIMRMLMLSPRMRILKVLTVNVC